jgi:hypothetical protein
MISGNNFPEIYQDLLTLLLCQKRCLNNCGETDQSAHMHTVYQKTEPPESQ